MFIAAVVVIVVVVAVVVVFVFAVVVVVVGARTVETHFFTISSYCQATTFESEP